MERALNGRVERVYNAEGQLVHERRMPSDDMLKWLLARLDPLTYGTPYARAAAIATGYDPRGAARAQLPLALASLGDVAPADCPVAEATVTEHRDCEGLCEGDITGHGLHQ
jgi:hypothetical protein